MASTGDIYRIVKSFTRNSISDLLKQHPSQGYLKEWVQMNYRWVDRHPAIPTIQPSDLIPSLRDLIVNMDVRYNYWNISPYELYLISCITITCQPKKIFEFGTYDGATTLQLAKSCPTSQIFTLDQSPNPYPQFTVGSRFADTPYKSQITQLYGDSTKFDYTDYFGKMDFIFVDGGHDYEIVRSDSLNAIKMVSPGGMIIWDDYLNYRGVKRAIDEIASQYPIVHLADTKFALLANE